MRVNTLCKRFFLPRLENNHIIFMITDDSRECIVNSVFFAIEGNTVDGNDKIEEAIHNGAKTIVTEKRGIEHKGINYIYTENAKRLLAMSLAFFYRKTIRNLRFIGVIGTNGKTTTSTLIYKYFIYTHHNSMLIGSNGCFARNYYSKHNNTTPRIVDLYQYFSYAKYKKIRYVIMEVSSVAIEEWRVMGIPFEFLVFTNFSEDHLDYHLTMERYFWAKAIPFYKLKESGYAIINLDDEKAMDIVKHTSANVLFYGMKKECAIRAKNLVCNTNGIQFEVDNHKILTNLIGRFNVYNILPLFYFQRILNMNIESVCSFLRDFRQVEGRMNLVECRNRNVIIDYAHTPEAINQVIQEVKSLPNNKVFVVIGCGGNREKEKRSKIGKILNDSGCEIILTSDNPRYEKPMDIIEDIKKGLSKEVKVIEDRKEAVIYALNEATLEDYVLILGKGCEEYMEIEGHKKRYSDWNVVEEWNRDNFHSDCII